MTTFYDDGTVRILHGDCRELLPGLHADVIVTDPPYALSFMGREWDRHPSPSAYQAWTTEWATVAYDTLPPGGWLLAFGGTRTWHRLASGLEDAGFELRDTIIWLYGSGFPKSRASLKPGWEPVIVARRPGSGVLQIAAARIGFVSSVDQMQAKPGGRTTSLPGGLAGASQMRDRCNAERVEHESVQNAAGRWPANVVLTHGPGCRPVGTRKVPSNSQASGNGFSPTGHVYSGREFDTARSPGYGTDGTETVQAWDCEPDCPVALLDQQSGELSTHGARRGGDGRSDTTAWRFRGGSQVGDRGGASRFYFTAKASRAERVTVDGEAHPTVKPLALMRWLVRLVTPPGGLVLDPFCGSGSTLVAAAMEGFAAVGIEADERWCRGSAKRVAERPPVQEVLALD